MGRATVLPPGISPPLTENNDYNHNALIVIIASFSLFLAIASLAIRVYASQNRGVILKDDYVLLLVVVIACTQISVALTQVHYGWGKSKDLISTNDYEQMTKTGFAVDILYIIVIGLSKIYTMMFYRNLSLRRNMLISNIILGFCSIWIVLGTVLLGVRCSSKSWENIDNSCAGLYPRWQTVCALDIILEIAILAYPVKIIYNVQIAFVKKIKVLCILSCRVVLIPISAIHLIYINTQTASSNPSLDGAYATTVAELHIGLSVILLTISSLKVFVAAYEDDQGVAYTDDGSKSHSQSGRPTRPGTWRASRPAKDPMFSTPAWDKEPILRSSVPSSRSHDMGALGGGAIMKSVQISVTRESIELEDRGAKAASASAEVSGAL